MFTLRSPLEVNKQLNCRQLLVTSYLWMDASGKVALLHRTLIVSDHYDNVIYSTSTYPSID